jgi:hypothetical protein
MTDIIQRWLKPDQAAAYIGRHRDELPRLVRSGKLPKPSYHFGPRSPRYDRLALDAIFSGSQSDSTQETVDAAIRAIRAKAAVRQKAAS